MRASELISPDPTGRWVSRTRWQCPVCGANNRREWLHCQRCLRSVRPVADEPIRPLDPLDLIGPGRCSSPQVGQSEVPARRLRWPRWARLLHRMLWPRRRV